MTIPDSVTTINDAAFQDCGSLNFITIGDSVTFIGPGAFYNCLSLTSVTIPDSATAIGYWAFEGCDSLEDILFEPGISRMELGGSSIGIADQKTQFLSADPTYRLELYSDPEMTVTIEEPGTYVGTAYFKWVPDSVKEYTVTFDPEGGTYVPSQTVEAGGTLGTMPSTEREGHTFAGWFTESGTPFGPDDQVTSDMTLHARWTVNTYTATFDFDDGSDPTVVEVEFGKPVSVPEIPSREGYEFVRWNPAVPDTMPANDLRFTAVWEKVEAPVQTFTVTFVTGGGTYVPPLRITEGETIGTMPVTEREGHTFTGWFTDAGCIYGYDFSTPVTSDLTLYAGWSVNTYTVAFDFDDGSEPRVFEVEFGAEIPVPQAPARDGYEFVGWDPVVPATMPAHDLSFTAVWQESETPVQTFTAIFDFADGSEPRVFEVELGAEIPVPEVPSRDGYEFVGWEPSMPDVMPAQDLSFTAVWEKVEAPVQTVTVTFVTGGGTAVPEQTVAAGTVIDEPSTTRTGHTFTGWFTDAGCIDEYDFSSPVTSDLTLR